MRDCFLWTKSNIFSKDEIFIANYRMICNKNIILYHCYAYIPYFHVIRVPSALFLVSLSKHLNYGRIICHLTQKSHNWQNRDGNVQNCYILSFHCLLTPVVTIYPIHTIYNHPNFICVKYELPTMFLWHDIPKNAFFTFF